MIFSSTSASASRTFTTAWLIEMGCATAETTTSTDANMAGKNLMDGTLVTANSPVQKPIYSTRTSASSQSRKCMPFESISAVTM